MWLRDEKYNFRELPLPDKCCQNCDHCFRDAYGWWWCDETGVEERVKVTNPERFVCDYWKEFTSREGEE